MSSLVKFGLIAGLLIAIIYFQSIEFPLLQSWDDPEYVTSNALIRSLNMAHLKGMFSSFSMGNYAPVHTLSYAIDYRLFGPNPAGFRVTNLLIHYLNSLLVFLLVRKVNKNMWIAAVAGVFFAIHPLQVESVVWVSQRKNVLSTLFMLVAFFAYMHGIEKSSLRSYWGSLLAFALGLLTKVSIVVFPVYIIAYDMLLGTKRMDWRRSATYAPFAFLSLGTVLITLKAQAMGGIRTEYYGNSALESMFVIPTLWMTYLRQILLPLNLSALYDHQIIVSLFPTKIIYVLFFITLLTCLVSWWIKRGQKAQLFWVSWLIVGLLPVSHLIPMVTIMNDRYLYFPIIGAFALMGMIARTVLKNLNPITMKISSAVLLITLTVGFSALSISRVKVWADDYTLWSDAVSKFPGQAKAHNNLGSYYMGQNEHAKAISEFKKALEIDPNLYLGRLNLGGSYLNINNGRAAVKELQRAIGIFDGDPKVHYYLGMAYHSVGDNESAIKELRWVVERFPEWSEVTLNLIRVYLDSDREKEAEALIGSARQWYQHDFDALSELGRMSESLRRSAY